MAGTYLLGTHLRRPDGSRVPVYLGATRLGSTSAGTGFALDLSAYDARDEERATLARAVEESPVGIAIADGDGTIRYANPRLLAFLGVAPDWLLGRRAGEIAPAFVDPGAASGVAAVLRAGGRWKGELALHPPLGKRIQAAVSIAPMAGALGVAHWVAVAEDVTDRRREHELLREAQRKLLSDEKVDAIGRLAGGVAHDLNNILTVVLGAARLLKGRLGASPADLENLEQILAAAGRGQKLTSELLAVGRRQVLNRVRLAIPALLADMRPLLTGILGEGIGLRLAAEAGTGDTFADPTKVEQILMNLAANARDAMPAGGTLTIEVRDADLDESYAASHGPLEPGRFVLLAVTDTGQGMDDEVRAKVFEAFFTTKPQGRGTGLGLSTVHGIVKQHGGYIWCYSEPGHGTTFRVYLPRADAPKPARLVSPSGVIKLQGLETVLVVDDQESLRLAIREGLEDLGYRVLDRPTGEAALDLLRDPAVAIQVLLTDLVMPGITGRELGARALALRPALRVLYMSGYTQAAVEARGLLPPGTLVLDKPFTSVALARAIRDVLSDDT